MLEFYMSALIVLTKLRNDLKTAGGNISVDEKIRGLMATVHDESASLLEKGGEKPFSVYDLNLEEQQLARQSATKIAAIKAYRERVYQVGFLKESKEAVEKWMKENLGFTSWNPKGFYEKYGTFTNVY